MPRCDIPIYTYATIQVGTSFRASTVGHILLLRFAVWNSDYVVIEWIFGVILHGLAQYILYFWMC